MGISLNKRYFVYDLQLGLDTLVQPNRDTQNENQKATIRFITKT